MVARTVTTNYCDMPHVERRGKVETPVDVESTEARSFSISGQGYTIDLCEHHAAAFDEAIGPFVAAGHRLDRNGLRRSQPKGLKSVGPNPAEVRAWAAEHGIDVPSRGRISTELRERYEAEVLQLAG